MLLEYAEAAGKKRIPEGCRLNRVNRRGTLHWDDRKCRGSGQEFLHWHALSRAGTKIQDEETPEMQWSTEPEFMQQIVATIAPVRSDRPLREVLAVHFPQDCGRLPIEGGWGYSQENPIVFVRELFRSRKHPNFVTLERTIAESIVYEELIIGRAPGTGFSGISVDRGIQALLIDGECRLDRITFEVTCWTDWHWRQLKQEWEQSACGTAPGFDRRAHVAKREAARIGYRRVLWFDVTSVMEPT